MIGRRGYSGCDSTPLHNRRSIPQSAGILLLLAGLTFVLHSCREDHDAAGSRGWTSHELTHALAVHIDQSDFEAHVKRLGAQQGIDSFILKRPAYNGVDIMKIAVLYPPCGKTSADPLYAVGFVPAFTAGGRVYLEYAAALAERGFAVFLPDIKGDPIHFIGLELFVDPLIDTDLPALESSIQSLRADLVAYTGNPNVTDSEIWDMFNGFYEYELQDQELADIFRDNIFAYRAYSLDTLVSAMFDVAADPASPLHDRLNVDRIGLEGHSLAPDEILEALVRTGGAAKYTWTDTIGVAILKAASTCLHGAQNAQSIGTPVFFMTGGVDNPDYIATPNWRRFNEFSGPAGYITLFGSGHMVFVDPPIGFLGDKFLPYIGSVQDVSLYTYTRNRAAVLDLCTIIYSAYLRQDPSALHLLRDASLDFTGDYAARNLE